MKHVFFLVSLTAVTVVAGSAGASVATADSAPEVHRYVVDGVTVTWGSAEDMSDLKVRHTPGSVNSATSASDRKIGAAVLAAYRRSGLEQDAAWTYATDYCTSSPDSYGKANAA